MLKNSLIELERYMYKAWRGYAKDDPFSSLSYNEFDYLKTVQYAGKPIRITDLAKEMNVTKPSASTMVVRLEKKGLLRRIACPDDARAKLVWLTEKAVQDLEVDDQIFSEISGKLEGRLSSEEAEQLTDIITKMLKN